MMTIALSLSLYTTSLLSLYILMITIINLARPKHVSCIAELLNIRWGMARARLGFLLGKIKDVTQK